MDGLNFKVHYPPFIMIVDNGISQVFLYNFGGTILSNFGIIVINFLLVQIEPDKGWELSTIYQF